MSISFFGDEYLARRGGSLQTRGDIDRIPQYRVVGHRAFSHVADESLACGDSRADLQMLNLRETAHSADNLKRRPDRSFGVVLGIKRGAEKSHHLITDQFIQSAIVVEDRI